MFELELVKRVYEKTLASEVSEVKFDEIPAKIAEILSKCLNKKVNVSGIGTVTIKVYIDDTLKKTVDMNLNNTTTLTIE